MKIPQLVNTRAARARMVNNSFIQSFLSTLELLFIRRTPLYPISPASLLIFMRRVAFFKHAVRGSPARKQKLSPLTARDIVAFRCATCRNERKECTHD